MPRPGPRPYECVRRAWHSDRHQPIRGSLIQEIFRVVCEIHGSATKKNKEWQEKLPVVVLKAEEIMYSKANSEDEYMDLKTLWDRTNDAINTIIRRDESTETGDLLQPCIEAALNLGCTPQRASRSQRNISPRCYLSPGVQEPCRLSLGMGHSTVQAKLAANVQFFPDFTRFIKPTIVNSTHLGSESQNLVCPKNNLLHNKLLFANNNIPLSNNNKCLPMETYPISNICSVYPLYYGNHLEAQHGIYIHPKSLNENKEPVKVDLVRNLLSCDGDTPFSISQTEVKHSNLNLHETECDLSLRLGSSPAPLLNVENAQLEVVKDVGYGCAQAGSKFNDRMPQTNTEPLLFTRVNAEDPVDSCSSKSNEHVSVNVTMKKRKAVFGHRVDDQQFCLQPKLPCNHLTSRMKM